MKVIEILRASKKHKYLALITYGGILFAINSKSVGISFRRNKPNIWDNTDYFSFIPLSLNEYISMKSEQSFARWKK